MSGNPKNKSFIKLGPGRSLITLVCTLVLGANAYIFLAWVQNTDFVNQPNRIKTDDYFYDPQKGRRKFKKTDEN